MTTTRLRYALIGAGHRAEMYVRAIAGPHAEVAELVAVVEANPTRAEYAAEAAVRHGAPARPRLAGPDDLERVLAEERVDRVIVTTPDVTHAGFLDRCLRAGVDVVVEKPLTIDEAGARLVAESARATGRTPVITFNYRYSPRNSALKELVASGAIGTVTSLSFEWLLDTSHGADYFRRWHRDKPVSGGLLVHKASHHFDLVNWWLDDVPERVFASGGLRFYGAENAERHERSVSQDRGSDDASSADPFALDMRRDARLSALYLDAEHHDGYRRDRSAFDPGITIEDNLALIVDYRGGATLSYALHAHSPWEGYRVAINGTLGRVELDVVERGAVLPDEDGRIAVDRSATGAAAHAYGLRPNGERLLLQRHWEAAVEVPITSAAGAHGGGDDRMLRDLFRGADEDPLGRAADYRDGLRSIAVGIAGNRSLESGRAVRVAELGVLPE
ncbi:Gfo/Idh/MocA family oxidoreductase [Rathayibacter sp. VKM Ac-2760]|uniref:Gfo/Idh/MocA family oxidoreductase n=1 Tax=Rathayibacter sp. VKM Ac-2760 TaxID=2609253 RepID=UPI001316983E|nr:Gfo/Idh/MocA family oxidoreductase [Rathayibacter sp. VKM Ac-2760]QHC59086.1 Gfo/Idh/MocA family oxidoreductase [Rathayibacter sp. VKM Ac-2760]